MRIFFCPFPFQHCFTSASPSRLPLPQVSASLQTPLPLKSSYTIAGGQGDLEGSVFGKQWGCAARRSFAVPPPSHSFHRSPLTALGSSTACLVSRVWRALLCCGVPGLLPFRCAAACPVSKYSRPPPPYHRLGCCFPRVRAARLHLHLSRHLLSLRLMC